MEPAALFDFRGSSINEGEQGDNNAAYGGTGMTLLHSRTFELILAVATAAKLYIRCDWDSAVWGSVNQTGAKRDSLPGKEKQ
jgi:hypothetical protein